MTQITGHFGASTVAPAALLGRADARRRDASDVGVHRRGAPTQQKPSPEPEGRVVGIVDDPFAALLDDVPRYRLPPRGSGPPHKPHGRDPS